MRMITAAAAALMLIHSFNSFASEEEEGSKAKRKKKERNCSVAWLREMVEKCERKGRMLLLLLSDEENDVRSFNHDILSLHMPSTPALLLRTPSSHSFFPKKGVDR